MKFRICLYATMGAVTIAALSFSMLVLTAASVMARSAWGEWGWSLPVATLCVLGCCVVIGWLVSRSVDKALGRLPTRKQTRPAQQKPGAVDIRAIVASEKFWEW
jgi:hypothetical protein